MINPKYLIIVFLCGCSSPPDHIGIWLNNNLDYLEFSNDSFYFAPTYSEYLYNSKYSLSNDTIKVSNNFIQCKDESICELKFIISKDHMTLNMNNIIKIGGFSLLENDSFYPANKRIRFFQYDSLIVSQFSSKEESSKLLSSIKISKLGDISLNIDKINSPIYYQNRKELNNEIGKIIGNQFKLWDEGEQEDGYFLRINIYRNNKVEHYSGSMIPYYFKHLRNVLNIAERKRINIMNNN